MEHVIKMIEMGRHCYCAALQFDGAWMATAIVGCPGQKLAEKTARERLHTQMGNIRAGRASGNRKIRDWVKGQDRLVIKWERTASIGGLFTEAELTPPKPSEPKIYELVKSKDEFGRDKFEVLRHDSELMTASEVKLAMSVDVLNNGGK